MSERELSEEERKQVAAFVQKLNDFCAGKIGTCLHCDMPFNELEQVGRCVYAYPCGHRQYQGTVPAKYKKPEKTWKDHPYFQEGQS